MKGGPRLTRIASFSGAWSFLSNFYPVVVKLDGEEYPSVEHAYQAAKFLDPKIREKFRMPGLAPGQAKNFAKHLQLKGLVRPDWKQVNLGVMRDLLVQKFTYSILRRKLVATFGAELVEGNYWHDNFFGDCLCDECLSIPGQNYLGRLLMEIRDGRPTPPASPVGQDSSTS